MTLRTWAARGNDARRAVHRWFADRELATLVLLAVLAGGLWAFAELAEAVRGPAPLAVDERILLAMRNPADRADPIGPRWFEEMGRDVTALGGVTVLTGVTLAAAGFLWLSGRHRANALLLVSVLGGWTLSFLMKRGFARPRPELVPHGAWVYTASFPSGHAMMSTVTWLTIAALVARVVPGRTMKGYVIACAVVVTLLIGVSRVYLGVHWPTDVLAGWSLGAAWAAACWLVAAWLERRRRARAGAAAHPEDAT